MALFFDSINWPYELLALLVVVVGGLVMYKHHNKHVK